MALIKTTQQKTSKPGMAPDRYSLNDRCGVDVIAMRTLTDNLKSLELPTPALLRPSVMGNSIGQKNSWSRSDWKPSFT